MLSQLIEYDQQLLLAWNGSDSIYWDGVWMTITLVGTWALFYASLLYVLIRSYKASQILFVILFLALAILLADQVASGICKPYFHRFRPTHEPLLEGQVDIVNGYMGGLYGFMSSHAANGFAICVFLSLVFRYGWITMVMLLYAILTSFSRIYLGVHYPGDILCGGLWGVICGLLAYTAYYFLCARLVGTRKFYSDTYTSSGILKEDASVPVFFFFLTLIGVSVYAIFIFR